MDLALITADTNCSGYPVGEAVGSVPTNGGKGVDHSTVVNVEVGDHNAHDCSVGDCPTGVPKAEMNGVLVT